MHSPFPQWLRPLLTKQDYEVYKSLMGLHKPRKTIEALGFDVEQIQASRARIAFYSVLYQLELYRQNEPAKSFATMLILIAELEPLQLGGDDDEASKNGYQAEKPEGFSEDDRLSKVA